jgi:hypothetical protein
MIIVLGLAQHAHSASLQRQSAAIDEVPGTRGIHAAHGQPAHRM